MRLLIIILLLFYSCSTKWHLKRAFKKDPMLKEVKLDSIGDTIITRSTIFDTTFTFNKIDTLIFVNDDIELKIFKYYDTIHHYVKCKGDTITYVKYINQTVQVSDRGEKWYLLNEVSKNMKFIILFALLFVFLVIYFRT